MDRNFSPANLGLNLSPALKKKMGTVKSSFKAKAKSKKK